MLMELFDETLTRIGVLNRYTFSQYTEQLSDIGEFEVDVAASEIEQSILRATQFILFEPDVLGIVRTLHSTDDETQDVQIKGCLANGLMAMRVIPATQTVNGTRTAIAREVVASHFINPSDPKRRIGQLILGNVPEDDTEVIRKQQTGGYVSDFLPETLSDVDMGYKVVPIVENNYIDGEISTNVKNLRFDIIKGIDRSWGNADANDVVEFSQNLRNVLVTETTLSTDKYKNFMYVAGEADEGSENPRIVLGMPIGTEQTGLGRYEAYVDARDLQSTYSVEVKNSDGTTDSVDKSYTPEQYEEMLRKRGLEKSAECIKEELFEAQIDTNRTQFQYGVDYKLGDYVSVVDTSLGIVAKCLVNSVTKSATSEGEKIDIQFGKPTLSWLKRVRKGGI